MKASDWLTKGPHRPPNDSIGDTDCASIYEAVGEITHTWEMIEHSLSTLFMILCETQSLAPGRAYGSINSNSGRCNMIIAAAEAYFLKGNRNSNIKVIMDLIKNVKLLSALRNVAAHGMVIIEKDGKIEGHLSYNSAGSYLLTPAIYNTGKTEGAFQAKIFYNSTTLKVIAEECKKLRTAIDVCAFYDIAGTDPSKFDASSVRFISS